MKAVSFLESACLYGLGSGSGLQVLILRIEKEAVQ